MSIMVIKKLSRPCGSQDCGKIKDTTTTSSPPNKHIWHERVCHTLCVCDTLHVHVKPNRQGLMTYPLNGMRDLGTFELPSYHQ